MSEELAQETIARVCRDWSRVRRKDSAEAWTLRVGINLANSYFRRRAAERRALQRLEARSAIERPPNTTDSSFAVRELVASLPRRERSVLILRYYADLTVEQVAQLMDMPVGTVKTVAARSLTKLREESTLKEGVRDVG